jgi:hypothetical protein
MHRPMFDVGIPQTRPPDNSRTGSVSAGRQAFWAEIEPVCQDENEECAAGKNAETPTIASDSTNSTKQRNPPEGLSRRVALTGRDRNSGPKLDSPRRTLFEQLSKMSRA